VRRGQGKTSVMSLRSVCFAALAIVAGLGGVTLVALEGRDVAILHTTAVDGTPRRTRVWVADGNGALWVEAASADRPFYRDLLVQPLVELERATDRARFVATPVPGREAHDAIRRMLRENHGWADAWIGVLQDTSGSIAVRLDPASGVAPPDARVCVAHEVGCP
jgi:hypothetical protein